MLIDDHLEAMAQLKSNHSFLFIVIEEKEEQLDKANSIICSIINMNRGQCRGIRAAQEYM